ncbi:MULTISPECIES: three-Cys-motif partner protein TcmP [unclassified Sphingopyxis]|uniref:three-Cys-motif partner protein TcmP n=1 Tax=unclassified Sphingopyxis TaxID=2614943 RepID=UPI0018D2066D|nr:MULTISPECIES: three-Cys-motif partner protein TcmP [unclassified Sphingopyxis]
MSILGEVLMVEHRFGGEHTELKLDVLGAYLDFYCNALKNQRFETWYIDGFAGTGFRQQTEMTGGIFDNEPIAFKEKTLLGSASIALNVDPPFDHYRFVEAHGPRRAALNELCDAAGARDCAIQGGDANDYIQKILADPPWSQHRDQWRQRAVVFLDPYGMSVKWQTLKALAESERADVWYLFNIKAVNQQMARDSARIDSSKFLALQEQFGTADWQTAFYRSGPTQGTLFGDTAPSSSKVATPEQISHFMRERLSTLFRYVSDPLPLTVGNMDRYFELYCLSNSPSPQAIALIKKGVTDIIRKRAQDRRQQGLP